MSCGLFGQLSKALSSVIRYENLRDILRERLKLSYITPINIGLVNQISAFLKPVTKLFDKLEGVLTFSINLLGPGSGFIWVNWVQGQQKWPSFISDFYTYGTIFKWWAIVSLGLQHQRIVEAASKKYNRMLCKHKEAPRNRFFKWRGEYAALRSYFLQSVLQYLILIHALIHLNTNSKLNDQLQLKLDYLPQTDSCYTETPSNVRTLFVESFEKVLLWKGILCSQWYGVNETKTTRS